ncbi:MAG: hypothetical protein EXS12_04455 [Phycisphaerales bacterium]|nr:hypothetical protein [Phycisphaerales bacterium]
MSASKKWFAFMATVLFCAQSAMADVVAAWNFNSLTGAVPTSLAADAGQGGLSLTEFTGGLSGLVGTDINAYNGDIAGQSLTVTGTSQNTKSLVIDVNTQGKKQLQFSMAARRSSSGFAGMLVQVWNGELWKDVGSVSANTTQFQLYSMDLSSFTFVENGALRLRIQFSGATSASGNARIDNLRVDGSLVPAPGAIAAAAAVAAAGARRGARTEEVTTPKPVIAHPVEKSAVEPAPVTIRAKKLPVKPK